MNSSSSQLDADFSSDDESVDSNSSYISTSSESDNYAGMTFHHKHIERLQNSFGTSQTRRASLLHNTSKTSQSSSQPTITSSKPSSQPTSKSIPTPTSSKLSNPTQTPPPPPMSPLATLEATLPEFAASSSSAGVSTTHITPKPVRNNHHDKEKEDSASDDYKQPRDEEVDENLDYLSSSSEDEDERGMGGEKIKSAYLVRKVETVIREGEEAILKSSAIVTDVKGIIKQISAPTPQPPPPPEPSPTSEIVSSPPSVPIRRISLTETATTPPTTTSPSTTSQPPSPSLPPTTSAKTPNNPTTKPRLDAEWGAISPGYVHPSLLRLREEFEAEQRRHERRLKEVGLGDDDDDDDDGESIPFESLSGEEAGRGKEEEGELKTQSEPMLATAHKPLNSPTPSIPPSPATSSTSSSDDIFISALYSILSTIPHPSLSRVGAVKEGVLTKHRADVFGSWKVKYCKVEVGLFTYSDSRKDPRAKSMVLGKNTVCKAIQAPRENDSNTLLNTAMKPISSMKGSSSKDYFFLLSGGGDGKEVVFSTKSKNDLLSWIRGIHKCIPDRVVENTKIYEGWEKDDEGREEIFQSMCEYMETFQGDSEDYHSWIDTLRFPINVNVRASRPTEGFNPESVSTGVVQIYKDLVRDNLSVNGVVYRGDKVGVNGMIREFTEVLKSIGNGVLSDVDVVVGARDVLLGCNRSRSGGDSYWVVNRCCVNNNPNVVLCPSDTPPKPITITVEKWFRREGVEGFVEIGRKRRRKVWARAKEGRIVYWERRGGRKVGEVELKDANLEELPELKPLSPKKSSPKKENPTSSFLIIHTSSKDIHIRFPSASHLTQWKLAIAEEISLQSVFSDTLPELPPPPSSQSPGTPGASGKKKMKFMNVLTRHKKDNSDEDLRRSSGQLRANNSSEVSAPIAGRSASLSAVNSPNANSDFEVPTRVQIGVKITVSVSNEYKVCTTDPDGDEDDVWAVVEGVFEQSYWLEKGEEIVRGEETVKINLID